MPSQKKDRRARARAKKVRHDLARRVRNRTARGEARTIVAKARETIESGEFEEATLAVGRALKTLDAVAGKGIVHRGNAGRRKSRLMARLNAKLREEKPPAKKTRAKRARTKTAAKS